MVSRVLLEAASFHSLTIRSCLHRAILNSAHLTQTKRKPLRSTNPPIRIPLGWSSATRPGAGVNTNPASCEGALNESLLALAETAPRHLCAGQILGVRMAMLGCRR